MNRHSTLAFIFVATSAILCARPEFVLSTAIQEGTLSWLGHTPSLDIDEPPPPQDHILEDEETGTISLGVTWHSAPEPDTGKCLGAMLYWRIPEEELDSVRYVVSVRRYSEAEVVFTLAEEGESAVLLQSPKCPLIEKRIVSIEDIGKAVTIITPEMLKSDPTKNDKEGEPADRANE